MSDPIQHVIVLMLENRSFDHFLGALPQVDGVNAAKPNVNFEKPGSTNSFAQVDNAVRKMNPDPRHETVNVLKQINGGGLGKMGGFVFDFADSEPSAKSVWPQVMAYFKLGTLPALHQLAQAFCVCDQWFSSVPGPTWTNRFFVHSGTSQGWVNMPDLPFHPNLHMYDQTTIYDRLNQKGIPWRIYAGDIPHSLLLYNQRKPENLAKYRQMSAFYRDVAQANSTNFPSFVFIEPSYLPFGQNDQHPPHDVLKGDELIANVYNAIRNNAALWESTLLIITWDEHGGFYDHVYPPSAVAPDHNVQEGFDFTQYGVRVPTLLISKWVAPGSVYRASGQSVLDHTSILRYLSDKFSLGPLGNRTASAASFSGAISQTANNSAPASVGTAPRPSRITMAIEDAPPKFNKNQAALIEFARHLESESGAPPEEIGVRALRASSSPQNEIEVAKERTWQFISRRSLHD